jgi:SAM-dependent methyltransferase
MGDPSVSFDRAATYYDQTRGLSPEGNRQQTELLARELRGRGRVVEVGVGTGQVALPLAAAGIRMAGLDLAEPMLRVLVEKAGGAPPFPLVRADVTRAPLCDDAFGAGIVRWVLHLIPDWHTALAELDRFIAPGGVVLILLGSYGKGPRAEIQDRFGELLGIANEPVGVMWGDHDTLDAAMNDLGASSRALPVLIDYDTQSLETFLEGIERNRYSWTWRVPERDLARVAPEVRAWAEDRFGPLDRTPPQTYEVRWRAYDLP